MSCFTHISFQMNCMVITYIWLQNLRELSVHLLKHAHRGHSPLHVHAVATRYVAAQLDMSRSLCRQLCLAAKVDPRQERQRGFPLMLVCFDYQHL